MPVYMLGTKSNRYLVSEKKNDPLPGCGHCSHTEGMIPKTFMSLLDFQVDVIQSK